MSAPSFRCQRTAFPELVAYRLGELSPEEAERLEEHYFSCTDCTRRLEWLRLLGEGIVSVVNNGGVSASVTADLVARAAEHGVTLRTYRLNPGQEVACTASPRDDFVVVRLGIPVEVSELESIDLATEIDYPESGEKETRSLVDVPFDRETGEVVYVYSGDMVRSLPRSSWTVEALVHGGGRDRRIGPYRLDHTPWERRSETES